MKRSSEYHCKHELNFGQWSTERRFCWKRIKIKGIVYLQKFNISRRRSRNVCSRLRVELLTGQVVCLLDVRILALVMFSQVCFHSIRVFTRKSARKWDCLTNLTENTFHRMCHKLCSVLSNRVGITDFCSFFGIQSLFSMSSCGFPKVSGHF
jgi:hypothetical protein